MTAANLLAHIVADRENAEFAGIETVCLDLTFAQADELIAALRRRVEPWRPISDDDIGKTMLVTNNLHANDAFGEMSHRWITMIQKGSEGEGYVGFEQYMKIYGLTHCAPIPPRGQT